MKGLYVLLLVVAVFAARSASQKPKPTRTRSGPPPRRGGRGGHPAVLSRAPAKAGPPAPATGSGGVPPAKSGPPPQRRGGRRPSARPGVLPAAPPQQPPAGPPAGAPAMPPAAGSGGVPPAKPGSQPQRRGGRRPSARPGVPPAAPPQQPPAGPPAAPPAIPARPARPAGPCNIAPVCGTDGYTYMSECFLWAGAGKACDGFCPCQQKPRPQPQPQPQPPRPPPQTRPVPSKPRYSQPQPRQRPPSCNCPVWGPQVCGRDGQTYDNDCKRRCNYTRHHCEGPCPCKGGKRGRKRKDSNQQNNKMGRSRRVNSKNLKTKNIPNESSKMSGTNQQSAPLIRTGKGQVKRQNKEIRRRPKSSQSYILPETTGKGVSGRGKPSLGKAKQNSIKASVPIQRSNPNLVNNNQPPVQPRPVIKGGRVATSYFENIGQLKIVNNKKSQPYIISNTGPSNEYAPVILKYRNNGIRGQAQSNTYRQSQQSGRSGNKQNTDTSKTIPKISISNTPARDAQYRAQYKIVRNIPQSGRTKTITGQRVNAGATSTTQKRMNTPVGGIQQGTLFNPGRNDQQQGSIRAKTDQPSNAGPSNNYLKKVKPNSPARDIIAIFDMTDVQGGPPPSQPVAKQTLIKEIQSGVSKFNARTGAASFTKTIKQGDKKTGLQSRGFNIKQATRSNVRQLPTIKESGTRLKSMKGLPVNLNLGKPITIKAKNLKTKPSGEKRRPKPAGGKRRPKPAGGKRRPKTNTIESRKQNVVSKSGNITQGRQQTRARNTGKDGLSEKQRQGKMLKTTAKPKRTSIGSDAGRRRPRNKKPACVCPGAIKQVCGKDGKTYKNACKMKCSGVQLVCNNACPCTVAPPKPPRCEDSCPRYGVLPVCSVDGTTFDSNCHLSCSGKTKACDGKCPCPTTPRPRVCEDYCPTAYTPVCTTDGDTYGNDCRRRCSGRRKACDYACPCPTPPAPKCEDLCPRSYRPVCGANGQTYISDCRRRCSGVPKDCDGTCPCRRQTTTQAPFPPPVSCENACLQDNTPVCARDGTTFKNDCFRKCSGKKKACNRRCPCRKRARKLSCKARCLALEPEPVCDVTGTTHTNDCFMKCSGKRKACNGECPCRKRPRKLSCKDRCLALEPEPVCDVTGTTHTNVCFMRCSGKRKACNGECPCQKRPRKLSCEDRCRSFDSEPVCDIEGTTHANVCFMRCSRKAKKCDGACPCRRNCEDFCPTHWSPVCGTDENTYNNECLMGCRKVRKQCNGQCPCPPPTTQPPPPPLTCEDRCHMDYKPVCTVWNTEYQNDCLRHCSGEEWSCDGRCPCEREVQQPQSPSCKEQCSWQNFWSGSDNWICTTDGNTKNSCEALCEGDKVACEGYCPCS